MRSAPLLLLGLTVALVGPRAAALDSRQPEPAPVQISVRMETVVLQRDAQRQPFRGFVEEALRQKTLSPAEAQRFRPRLAAGVASGQATITDSLSISILEGTLARMTESGRTLTVLPRLKDGQISAEVTLAERRPGGEQAAEPVRETAVVPNDGLLVLRHRPSPEGPERLLLLRFARPQ